MGVLVVAAPAATAEREAADVGAGLMASVVLGRDLNRFVLHRLGDGRLRDDLGSGAEPFCVEFFWAKPFCAEFFWGHIPGDNRFWNGIFGGDILRDELFWGGLVRGGILGDELGVLCDRLRGDNRLGLGDLDRVTGDLAGLLYECFRGLLRLIFRTGHVSDVVRGLRLGHPGALPGTGLPRLIEKTRELRLFADDGLDVIGPLV
ncbi:MAG: hypothetical protein WAV90_23660 [Gordonia amarae]